MTDCSRRAWMLTALLLRLAKALYLHQELPNEREPLLMVETKRRLWHHICMLDTFFALDRGSEPIVRPSGGQAFATPPPRNINDCDFDETTTHDTVFDEERFTEMSYTIMTWETSTAVQKLCSIEELGETCEKRIETVQTMSDNMERKCVRFCKSDDPLQRLSIGIAKTIRSSMMLRAIRPFHRPSHAPPGVENEWVLELAVDSLRTTVELVEDPVLARWRRLPWVPWHAIAVALASLCHIRGTDLAAQAWAVVNRALELYKGEFADTKRGTLWKRISRLRAIAETFQNGSNGTTRASHQSTSMGAMADNLVRSGMTPMGSSIGSTGLWATASMDLPVDTSAFLPESDTWYPWEDLLSGFQDNYFDTDPSIMPLMSG